jgi:D-alanyl-D-alanine carboxypeptidase/D-alanyl-D-alanine-endopeptidase (penicillin-binding protein 4)
VPSGDPTLLHPAFPDQPVIRFLQKTHRNLYLTDGNWQDRPLGYGWAWDDYNDDYMPERNAFPVYGNLIRWMQDTVSGSFYSIPDIDWPVRFSPDSSNQGFSVRRDFHSNSFEITEGRSRVREQDLPFITEGSASAALLLKNDARIIDTLLNGDLKDLPQRPVWVDGSGLSRNDLFTPQDFIWLLNKMSKDFGLARMKGILPTGGKGTLSSYYKQDSGYIYAKTGSLSGVAALSGYLITKKNHLLLFSILINNYTGSGVTVRRQMEQWIHRVRELY